MYFYFLFPHSVVLNTLFPLNDDDDDHNQLVLSSMTREAEQCVRNFASNCVKPFARQYINLMLAGPTHVLRKRCSNVGIKSKQYGNIHFYVQITF